jgi:hypothetical protein
VTLNGASLQLVSRTNVLTLSGFSAQANARLTRHELQTLSCPITFLEMDFWLKRPQKRPKSDPKNLIKRRIQTLGEPCLVAGLLSEQAEKGRFHLKNGHTSKLEKIWDKIRCRTGNANSLQLIFKLSNASISTRNQPLSPASL